MTPTWILNGPIQRRASNDASLQVKGSWSQTSCRFQVFSSEKSGLLHIHVTRKKLFPASKKNISKNSSTLDHLSTV